MTERQRDPICYGAAVLLAHFRGDAAGRGRLVAAGPGSAAGTEPELAEALTQVAVLAVTLLAEAGGTSVLSTVAWLPQVEDRVFPPPAGLPWAHTLGLVAALSTGSVAAARLAARTDPLEAANGAFAVAVSAFQQLQMRHRKEPVGTLEALATPGAD